MVFRPELDPTLDAPLYRQLSIYFRHLIDSGDLPVGERLPATRELAGQLGINRTTVSAAYEILESEGLISGQVGRGSFVAPRTALRTPDWANLLAPAHNSAQRQFASGVRISFAVSRPPEELFPLEDFRQSCQEVLASPQLGSMLQLGPTAGYEPLRQYLLEEARREEAFGRDDDLLITNGCQQALDLLRRVLVRPGMRVAVEDPVYPGLKNVMLAGGADLVPLPSKAAVAVVTPNFQNPTGLTMPLEERQELLRAAGRDGAVVIENDIYTALRYEGAAVPSLKQLAPDAGTVLLRSFSKVAFPGIRLGWVIGPRPLVAAMRQTKQLTDLHSDQFSQAVMLRFAESGRLTAHVENMIEAGRERLRVALESAERFLPAGSRFTRPQGGMNLWITLPQELDAASLLDRAEREGVAYLPGSVFAVACPANNALRLSFGGSSPDRIRRGIEILGSVFSGEQAARRQAELEPMAAFV